MEPRQTHFRMLSQYNRWANERLYLAASQLSRAALALDRGAFFRSILGTLNHLLVTDCLWMSRLEGTSPRGVKLNTILHETLGDLHAARRTHDQKIVEFVHELTEERLAETLAYETTSGAPQSQPLHEVLAHIFNHQTHHRGQAHHLVGQALGQEKAPVLDLMAYQRSAASATKP
jgi:uncharacterized damage-inducible protein DinB